MQLRIWYLTVGSRRHQLLLCYVDKSPSNRNYGHLKIDVTLYIAWRRNGLSAALWGSSCGPAIKSWLLNAPKRWIFMIGQDESPKRWAKTWQEDRSLELSESWAAVDQSVVQFYVKKSVCLESNTTLSRAALIYLSCPACSSSSARQLQHWRAVIPKAV